MTGWTVSVDWDDTLVNAKTGEWLPGAREALGLFKRRGIVVGVQSCRANWPEGRAAILAKLQEVRLGDMPVTPKIQARLYIDDRAHRFTDWDEALRAVSVAVRQ